MTSFIGTTWQQRQKFLAQQEHENNLLEAIADHIYERMERRKRHIDKLRREIRRLEKKDIREFRIRHEALDRCIDRNKRICALFDELNAYEEHSSCPTSKKEA